MSQRLFKLGCLKGDIWVEHSHSPLFERDDSRIVATAPASDVTVFRKLTQSLEPPLFLPYILHTPRGESIPGRYQSPSLSNADMNSFLNRFSDFLASDSRFDLWAHSPAMRATVVWDRHNLIHAYGPLESFEACLLGLGFSHGSPSANFVHQHHYHAEFDSSAAELLKYFDWSHTPLRPEDEQ